MAVSNAVDQSAVARTLGIEVAFKNLRGGRILYLPQRIGIVGQGNTLSIYSTDKKQVFSAQEVGSLYGFGSPLHLAAKQIFPANGDGVGIIPVTVYPLEDDASGVASDGTIVCATGTQTSTQEYILKINSITTRFVLEKDDNQYDAATKIVNAINGVIDMPVIAAVDGVNVNEADVTSKWKGASANDIKISIDGTIAGITFTITQPVNGAANPDVDDALNQLSNIWETILINCMEYTDTDTLDKFNVAGESRWGALVRKPLVVFTGSYESTEATLIAAGNARKTDRINSIVVTPLTWSTVTIPSLPLEIAARTAARVAIQANNNPPVDYAGDKLTFINSPPDTDQKSYAKQDILVKAGISTIEIVDGIVELSDIVSLYHPTGEEPPAYRYIVDIMKVFNLLFNTDLIFNSDKWKKGILVTDDTITVNPKAVKPKDAIAEIFALIDNASLDAWIVEPDTAKETVQAQISSTNPKRLDLTYTVQLSGNTNIISITMNFGFYFGEVV